MSILEPGKDPRHTYKRKHFLYWKWNSRLSSLNGKFKGMRDASRATLLLCWVRHSCGIETILLALSTFWPRIRFPFSRYYANPNEPLFYWNAAFEHLNSHTSELPHYTDHWKPQLFQDFNFTLFGNSLNEIFRRIQTLHNIICLKTAAAHFGLVAIWDRFVFRSSDVYYFKCTR